MNGILFILVGFVIAVHSTAIGAKIKDDVQHNTKRSDENLDWWQNAVFYQIYTRSFMDTNGDGIGDIQGIKRKLDYLQETGFTALWLSPILKSPQVDQGYDISDYLDVDPSYGSLHDLEEMLEIAHRMGIRVILDIVPNHTSDQHVWFQLSENKTEGYEDFYVWHDGGEVVDDVKQIPNNWISRYGGSAWEWSEIRQQFFLHQFNKYQPDLNYSNPLVLEAMKNVLTYWLDFGIDGFGIAAAPHIFEDSDFRDEPLASEYSVYDVNNYDCLEHSHTKDLDDTFDLIYQFRELLDNYSISNNSETKILLTQADTTTEKQLLYYGSGDGSVLGAHLSFNFNLVTIKTEENFTVRNIVDCIFNWIYTIRVNYTSNWVLGNHDTHRVASRFGKENVDGLNMLIAILPGVMVTYSGEEIGMENGEVSCEQGQDPQATNCSTFDQVSRDFERTPFQWDDSTNADFTVGTPWLPVSEKASEVNLAAQNVDGLRSHYNIYKELLNFRKTFVNLSYYNEISSVVGSNNILQFTRGNLNDLLYYLYFNIGDDEYTEVFTRYDYNYEVMVTSEGSLYTIGDILSKQMTIQPHEGIILRAVTETEKTIL